MIVDERTLDKPGTIEQRYAQLRYEKIADVAMEMYETKEHFRGEPDIDDSEWEDVAPGTNWGDSGITGWFRGDVALLQQCGGRTVFVRARTGGETLFIADGICRGVFDEKHDVVMLAESAEQKTYHLTFETYCGHSFPGTQPDGPPVVVPPDSSEFEGVEILLEREDVTEFVYNLRILRQLYDCLDDNSLRRGEIASCLQDVFAVVDARPTERDVDDWRPKLKRACEIMQPLLAAKNATSPTVALIGHSHIDTAWLWPIAETWRKCARTFSSALNLMKQYPEFKFLQPAPCHAEKMRELYPDIFQRMQRRAEDGRWEINGAMWVEADCNIPSGEALVRQCVVGQQATREMFGTACDTLWLPDVFGYSAALPQILKGCGVDYFCTSKIAWNDTTRFPFDTFRWEGIDGTSVLAHYTAIQGTPDPKTLHDQWNWVQHTDVQDRRLFPVGYGDGGGGPTIDNMETVRRVKDLEGCPRTEFTTVSEFMNDADNELADLPRFVGELYLEFHRGTLTSIAKIKRYNRKAELALRDAEFLATLASLQGADYPQQKLDIIWKRLLTNQFHDILPGSSIAQVNDEAIEELQSCVENAEAIQRQAADRLVALQPSKPEAVVLFNSLNWWRDGEMVICDLSEDVRPAGPDVTAQSVRSVWGEHQLAISGPELPPLGSKCLQLQDRGPDEANSSPFTVNDRTVDTPFARVQFDEHGRIASFIDDATANEIIAVGGRLNCLYLGEDEPSGWDNWEIEPDQELKMKPETNLTDWRVVADGPLQLRIRVEYQIGESSRLMQDIIFHSTTPRVDFETVLDWSEKHQLLKTGFDLNILAARARHEIQYGHVQRPTHRNRPQDRAQFEVCAHKWTDMSESRFGVALLNDCKYGIGVLHNELRLTLMKSGTHPDARGDAGTHRFTYSLLPHDGFCVPSVVRPAYELNIPPIAVPAARDSTGSGSFLTVDADNVIVESIKWAEDGGGFIVRLYEAERTRCTARIEFEIPVRAVSETNMLEENARPVEITDNAVQLDMTPFQIRTLYCEVNGQ